MFVQYRSDSAGFSVFNDQYNTAANHQYLHSRDVEETTMVGKTVSHYRVLEKIGEGGMGCIYRALDLNLQREVALKVLSVELCKKTEERNRFLHEARLLSSLEHPHICTIHDIFEDNNSILYMVMTCYKGKTLRHFFKQGKIARVQALLLIKQIGYGLDSAHKKGIIHQDIKPDNIIVTTHGIVKIIDFGVAQFLGRNRNYRRSATVGTPAYMSPEQIRQMQIDERTDIWSLGVVFYEMLAGHLPFENEFEEGLIYSILNEPPLRLHKTGDRLDKIVFKCLEKDREKRYQNMKMLLSDLEVLIIRNKRLAKL